MIAKVVDVVIVNWNSGDQLIDLLSSFGNFDGGVVGRVVVVDNGSRDGSAEALDQRSLSLRCPMQVLRNPENRGFAAACNQGASVCHADFILFLNPDTRLFADSLGLPAYFLSQAANEDVAIVGIQLVDNHGVVSRTCARFPSLTGFIAQAIGLSWLRPFRRLGHAMTEWDHQETRYVDQVMGAFFLIRRDVFESLGGFDERFFVYFEEVDLSLRARNAGWRTVFLAEARAFHEGGGTSRQVKPMRLFYSLRSRLLFGFKHFPRWQAWALTFITLAIEPISRMALCLVRRKGLGETWRGYWLLYKEIPSLLATARQS